MQIKQGFVLREVAGQTMVIATGEASKDFYGMIKLNSTGKEIWLGMQKGLSEEQIAEHLTEVFEVEKERAVQDTHTFISEMKEKGFLVNE